MRILGIALVCHSFNPVHEAAKNKASRRTMTVWEWRHNETAFEISPSNKWGQTPYIYRWLVIDGGGRRLYKKGRSLDSVLTLVESVDTALLESEATEV
jgi:hypothetical protein